MLPEVSTAAQCTTLVPMAKEEPETGVQAMYDTAMLSVAVGGDLSELGFGFGSGSGLALWSGIVLSGSGVR